jgi:hypothetical protein
MGNVLTLNPNQPKSGETSFIACNCTGSPEPFVAVAIAGPNPVICALVCLDCEKSIPVVNGIVGADE